MKERELLGTAWTCERAGTGRFHCPHCRADHGFVRTRLRQRLIVLWRAVATLGGAADYVTCDNCGHAYPAALAEADSPDSRESPESPDSPFADAVLAEDELALLGVVSAMVLSDSSIRDSEKEACREVVRRYMGRSLPSASVDELLRDARARWGDPVSRLARLRCLVPESIKRRIVAAAYHICTADGELHGEESQLLVRIGEALDLGPREVRRALGEAKTRPVPLPGDG